MDLEQGELEDSNDGIDWSQLTSTDPLGLNRLGYDLLTENNAIIMYY